MTELALRILAVFADSYPTSAHYRGGRKLRKAGWERVFPRTVHDVEAKNDFLDAVEELVRTGVLSAKWKRFREGDELEALILEKPDAMFELLGRPSPETVAREMVELLRAPQWSGPQAHPRCAELAAALLPRLEAGHPVAPSSAAELADLGRVFALSREDAGSAPIRALSVRLFAASKRLEELLPLADRMWRSQGESDLSEELGLARSYPEVSVALRGTLTFSGGASWPCAGRILTLPLSTVEAVVSVELDEGCPPALLSVENKETFYVTAAAPHPDVAALVYTAGHPNRAVTAFLRILAAAGASLRHYGDLDPDGIRILTEIESALGMPVEPCLMSADVHRRYARFGYRLDKTQLSRLSQVAARHPDLRALAVEIARTGVGVEQEIIDTVSESELVPHPAPPHIRSTGEGEP